MRKILIIDDEQSVRYSFGKLLASNAYHLVQTGDALEALQTFAREKPHLVILDIEMPGKDGLQLLQEIKALSPQTPVIMITAFGSGDRVIKAMRYGAFEYVEKPFDIPRLKSLIDEALGTTLALAQPAREAQQPKRAKTPGASHDMLVGESPAIKEVYKLIGRVAASDASILVMGESGTGKELVARAIHRYSDRAAKPFLAINCAAIPETLLESELFGHEKGAFTGADRLKPGRFEEAHGGTLLLDEIGDMSLPLQAKLLRVLQEGAVERLGGSRPIPVDVRVVAATNRNLERDILAKSFREDLYYRIKVISITLPPLRVRTEDIPLLVQHFLEKHAKGPERPVLHPDAMRQLMEYPWPGNVRELENVINRALILAKGAVIGPTLALDAAAEQPLAGGTVPNARLAGYLMGDVASSEGQIYKGVIDQVERDLIAWALEKSGRNQVQTAKLLGISRVMLHDRMEKYGMRG